MNTVLRAALGSHYATLTSPPVPHGGAEEAASPAEFRAVMGALPTGVSLLTTRHATGVWAMTVGSLTSLSLDPPLLLVCLRRSSATLDMIAGHGRFAVSVLAAGHAAVADTFARPRDRAAVEATPFSTFDDLPVLPGALAWLTCGHEHTYTSGDHAIVIGAVRRARREGTGEPLVRHDSRYRDFR
ncbi:flavin reductase family protein [Herbidospora sp. RD11066]